VDGYPGVLYQWTQDYQRTHMQRSAASQIASAIREERQERRADELDVERPHLEAEDRAECSPSALDNHDGSTPDCLA
jgi:hypothetical protein